MAEERIQRRLAAILAADVVGYSRLMEQDEAGTLAALKARRKGVLEPLAARHQGRVFKVTGDGVLIEFASAVNAVQCAIDLQRDMAAANDGQPEDRHVVLRIGVNLGDVMVEGSDLYGDGVNIAARLEAIAEPGGILVSSTAHHYVRNKVKVGFDDLGDQTLKNIAEPVRTYRVVGTPTLTSTPLKPITDKPSIAVLPFTNMSGDPEQEYFSDGIVEEIITELSRFRSLFVIARNSSFTYKGRAVDVKQVGRELGVRYVLEGSVRKAGGRVRIIGQLIEVSSGAHLWADRFEGALESIFDLQDQVTASVVGAIAPKLEEAEIERVKHKPTENLDAYDHFLRGMAGIHKWSREGNDEALSHFYRAIELDRNYAAAYGLAARAYVQRNTGGWVTNRAEHVAESERLARRAAELGRHDAVALCTAGFALCDIADALDDADPLTERALELNPNLAWAWLFSGWAKISLGNPEATIERVARAMRLSPQDPQIFSMQTAMACAHFVADRYAETLSWAEKATRERPTFSLPMCIAAASAALDGKLDEARKLTARLRGLDPALRLSELDHRITFRRPEDLAKLTDGMRQAGLPD